MVELESNLLEKCSRKCIVFEDHRKSLIYHCKLSLHFEWPKIDLKCPKQSIFGEFFCKPEVDGQTVLPDRSLLNWTKIDGKCQN